MSKRDDLLGAPAFRRRSSFLLAALGRRTESAWAGLLRERGVTNTEFAALAVLASETPSQRDLARFLGIDPRNAVALVHRLVERGWVASAPDAGDRRRLVLTLTGEGREFWDRLASGLGKARSDWFAALDAGEQSELERLLNKLNDAHLDVASPGARTSRRGQA